MDVLDAIDSTFLEDPSSVNLFGNNSKDNLYGSLATGFSLAATGLDVFGKYASAKAQVAADEYNAQLVMQSLGVEEGQIQRREDLTLSEQRAMYAKAGVESMAGSPLTVALNTATQFEYDKQVAQYNAQSRADMYRYQAEVTKQKSQFDIASTLLSGASDVVKIAGLL